MPYVARERETPSKAVNTGISQGYPGKCLLVYSAAMVVLEIMCVSVAAALCCAFLFWRQSSRRVGTPPQRATYEVLHTASQAVSVLRDGLTPVAAVKAAPSLRHLLGTPTVAIADEAGVLACQGSDQHVAALADHLRDVVTSGHSKLLSASDLGCGHGSDCQMRAGVAVPIAVDGAVIGALAAMGPSADGALMRTTTEVARFVSTHLALAELDASRTRTVQAQLNFLRA
jgi:two-component system, LytTR family, sensor kinase